MLKRRVTESTLDTYAARMRPADLTASAFRRPASRPVEDRTVGQRPTNAATTTGNPQGSQGNPLSR